MNIRKRCLCLLLTVCMCISLFPSVAFAAEANGPAPEIEQNVDVSVLADGMFYLPTRSLTLYENGEGAVLTVCRTGAGDSAESVRLTFTDYTARFGTDYTVELLNGGELFNEDDAVSVLEVYAENPDAVEEYNYSNAVTDGALDGVTEETEDEETEELKELAQDIISSIPDASPAVEVTGDVSSLAGAKANASGLPNDKRAMDISKPDADSMGYFSDSINELNDALQSVYIIIPFKAGQTVASLRITPVNDRESDGDRSSTLTLSGEDGSVISAIHEGCTLAIKDDEEYVPASFSFSDAEYVPAEDEPFIRATIERSGNMTDIASVMLDTSDGTAISGRDHSAVHAQVVFPFGITKRTVNIPVSSEYIDSSADFTLKLSEPVNSVIGDQSTAKGVIFSDSMSFGASRDINLDDYITGDTFVFGENGVSASKTNGGNSSSYINISGSNIKMYLEDQDFWGRTVNSYVHVYFDGNGVGWDNGVHWDYNGIEINWSRSSDAPNYGGTKIYTTNAPGNDFTLMTSNNERWDNTTDRYYFNNSGSKDNYSLRSYHIALWRSEGCWGTSPTLNVTGVKPILRPFKVTLAGADPVMLVKEDGTTAPNTSVAGFEDGSKVLLENADNMGTGSLVTVTGGSVTLRLNDTKNNIAYIKGVQIVNDSTGETRTLVDNLPVGTTSYSFNFDNNFVLSHLDYINFQRAESSKPSSAYGSFKVKPVLANIPVSFSITDNENVSVSPEKTSYNRGDFVKLNIDVTNPARFCNKLSITPENGQKYYLEKQSGKDYVGFNIMGKVSIEPYVEVGDSSLLVRVEKNDLELFDQSRGIFTSDFTESGIYRYYTVIPKADFEAGEWQTLTAVPKGEGTVSVWKEPSSGNSYCQNTFYFETKATGVDDNILTLSASDADKSLPLKAQFFYTDSAIGDPSGGSTYWLPATGATLMIDGWNYGIMMEDGTFSAVGKVPVVSGMRVRCLLTASSNVSYLETTVDPSASSISFGTKTLSPNSSALPHFATVTVTNSEDVLLSVVPIDDTTLTTLTAEIANDGAHYIDAAGVEHEEHVEEVEFLVYDSIMHELKTVLSMEIKNKDGTAQTVHSIKDGNRYSLTSSFKKGERQLWSSSDLLYVRLTTDRWIGDGSCYDSEGNKIESDESNIMQQTTYAPVRTRYIFAESNPQILPTYDFEILSTSGMCTLPIIGDLTTSINVKNFNLGVTQIPNGIRFSVGVIPKGWIDKKHANGVTDNGNPVSFSDIKSNFTEMSNAIENSMTGFCPGNYYLGMPNWTINPYVGIYMDFAIRYDVEGEKVNTDYLFTGGGGYVGLSGTFRYTFYMLISGFPVYAGFEVGLYLAGDFGLAGDPGETRTYDDFANGRITFDDFKFDFLFGAELDVYGYIGAGICQTAGIRGGAALFIYFIYNPTIQSRYSEVRETGWRVQGQIKIWMDVLLASIPIPIYEFTDENFGYFEDVNEINSGNKNPLTALDSVDDVLPISKPRPGEKTTWETLMSSTLNSQVDSTIANDNYDEPEITLSAYDSNGDGRDDKVLMVFLDDDGTRSEEERTALMYSIYDVDNGTWKTPEILQDDGTADFSPSLAKANDGIMICWTSRAPGSSVESYSDRFRSMEVYCCLFDAASSAPDGSITRLTNDNYYDFDPCVVADPDTGDMLVHYTKAEVRDELLTGRDIIETALAFYNKGENMYMLYDGESGRWVTDKYYSEELAPGANEEELIKYWNGQRFLLCPIEDAEQNDPIISDFQCSNVRFAFSPESRPDNDEILKSIPQKNWGVYAYTVDFDNNLNTEGDRELYVQLYDYDSHTTSKPIRITKNAFIDSNPAFAGDYLFWSEGDGTICYFNMKEAFAANLSYVDGEIQERTPGSWTYGYVDTHRCADTGDLPSFGSFVPFVDAKGTVYVVWQQMASSDNGDQPSQELYVSALTHDADGTHFWSDAHRLTHDEEYNDLPGIVSIDDETLLMVSNCYNINISSDEQNITDTSIVAYMLTMVSSLDAELKVESSAYQVINDENNACTVSVTLRNTGLNGADGFAYSGQLFKNGVPVPGTERICRNDNEFIPAGGDYTDTFTLTGLDTSALGQYTYKLTYKEGRYEDQTAEFSLFSGEPEYVLSGLETYQTGSGFILSGQIANHGSGASRPGDEIEVIFNDLYHTCEGDEVFGKGKINSLIGRTLGVSESVPFSMELSVSTEKMDKGCINACALVKAQDGSSLGVGETFTMGLENPYYIKCDQANGNKIILSAGSSLNLSAKYGASDFFRGGIVRYAVQNPEIASIEGNKLTGLTAGTTTLEMTVQPYGGTDTVTVTVQEAERDDPAHSGGGEPTYAITGANTENGKLIISWKGASAGSTVTFTVAPDEGYKLNALTVKDAMDNALTLTKVSDTIYTFTMPTANVTITATFAKSGTCPQDATCVYAKFTDADTKAWYHDGVHFCVENGYMNGISDTKFAPSGTLSRAMIVTMLWRMEGEPVVNYAMTFKDVKADHWYTEAIRWAQSKKIVEGYSADSFGPDNDVTREQLAAILYRYAQSKGEGFTGSWMFLLDFVDRADISSWADEAVHWCSMKSIVNGKDGKVFDPQGNATRAEAATMIQRFCEKMREE